MKKILALLLALCMIFALAACGEQAAAPAKEEAPAAEPAAEEPAAEEPAAEEPAAEDPGAALAAEAWEYDPTNYYDESATVYDSILGEYYEYYQQALATSNVSERYALEAIAEAKLLNAAIMLPTTTQEKK